MASSLQETAQYQTFVLQPNLQTEARSADNLYAEKSELLIVFSSSACKDIYNAAETNAVQLCNADETGGDRA